MTQEPPPVVVAQARTSVWQTNRTQSLTVANQRGGERGWGGGGGRWREEWTQDPVIQTGQGPTTVGQHGCDDTEVDVQNTGF